jgi:sugar O-acyltransferase (sialic acid O-acetyltransferase NeuD family)
MLYVGRTDDIALDAMGMLERGRNRTHGDAGTVMLIGDGGHASVLKDFPSYPDGLIIAIGDNRARSIIAQEQEGMRPAAVFAKMIHPLACVSPSARIGAGTVVMAHAVIAAGAVVGKHCIVNHGATVDHACVIGDYAHIAPGAHLCGHVEIGDGALVGVGVGIAPGCKIPAWSLVKARRLEIVPLSSHG